MEQTLSLDTANFAADEQLIPVRGKPRRYYADLCAPFPFEPNSHRVMVVGTPDKGEGLIALRTFRQGEIVFRFHGEVRNDQTLFTLQQAPGVFVEDPLVMGKVLHACDPNMHCDMETLTFTATRDIHSGETLTMDYETTEDELFRSFHCGCGSIDCRGLIRGRLFRNT